MSLMPAPDTSGEVTWNKEVRLILADVDQTLADDYTAAEPAMIEELTALLRQGCSLFLITGGPLDRLRNRLIDRLPAALRQRVLASHCSGAEVWGFAPTGQQRVEPFYSLYDKLVTDRHKKQWREVVAQLIKEFKLTTHTPQTVEEFRANYGDDPFAVIYEDRGPQITLEVINGYDMTDAQRQQVRLKLPHLQEVIDFREPIVARAQELLTAAGLPITPRFGGVFAVDLALKGVSKAQSITEVLARPDILQTIGIEPTDMTDPQHLEIWGDRFDQDLGTDWLMCQAVDPRVRAIDFRGEEPARFPKGYNIVLWPGQQQLHAGTLEYLQSRSTVATDEH
jgi:hydroxymethylpyrimidine pyrophosphatase-like HAD family hydrolase